MSRQSSQGGAQSSEDSGAATPPMRPSSPSDHNQRVPAPTSQLLKIFQESHKAVERHKMKRKEEKAAAMVKAKNPGRHNQQGGSSARRQAEAVTGMQSDQLKAKKAARRKEMRGERERSGPQTDREQRPSKGSGERMPSQLLHGTPQKERAQKK